MPEYPFYILLIVFAAHLFFESYRWQLTLFYLVIILYILLFAFLIRAKLRRKAYSVNLKPINRIVVLVTLFTVVLSISVPVISIPEPTGLKNVGTVTYPIVNPKRLDAYSESGKEVRNFNIQIFYPSDDRTTMRQAWLGDDSASRGMAKYLNLPSVFTSHMGAVVSNSYHDITISGDRPWPVVIVSHGWKGFRNIHQDICEDLASWGYVVVAVDHTYGSLGTTLADGTVQLYNEEALPKREASADFLVYGDQLIETYAEDISDTLRALDALNEKSFNGSMDLESIALIGHSTGGGAALKTTMLNDRIDALIAYDPWVEPMDLQFLSRGTNVPMLIFSSTDWVDGYNAQNLERVVTRANGETRHYEAVGFGHVDFTLAPNLTPWANTIGLSGEISNNKSTEILRDYNLTFLNSVFRGGADLSDLYDNNYDEVRLISSVYNIGN